MKNLSKTQWTTFIITAVTMAFALFANQGGILGLGAKGVAIVGFLKTVWDLYISFNAQNVADFASENAVKNSNAKIKSLNITVQDVKNWSKNK